MTCESARLTVLADVGGSLWNIRPWEAAVPLVLVLSYLLASALLDVRARENRARLRRRRRSERELARRMRTW